MNKESIDDIDPKEIDDADPKVVEDADLELEDDLETTNEIEEDSSTEESDLGLQDKMARKMNLKLAGIQRGKRSEKDIFDKDKVLEAVFDKSTVMTLSRLINNGIISYVNGAVGAGKESQIYWAVDPTGIDLAVKIYLVTTSNFKKRYPYLIGDPRFTRIKSGTRSLVELWAKKECGAPATLHVIDSRYGHDAFLKETGQIGSLIAETLDAQGG